LGLRLSPACRDIAVGLAGVEEIDQNPIGIAPKRLGVDAAGGTAPCFDQPDLERE